MTYLFVRLLYVSYREKYIFHPNSAHIQTFQGKIDLCPLRYGGGTCPVHVPRAVGQLFLHDDELPSAEGETGPFPWTGPEDMAGPVLPAPWPPLSLEEEGTASSPTHCREGYSLSPWAPAASSAQVRRGSPVPAGAQVQWV